MDNFAFKGVPMTTIDCVGFNIGDNLLQALSIFLAEGKIRYSGEILIG